MASLATVDNEFQPDGLCADGNGRSVEGVGNIAPVQVFSVCCTIDHEMSKYEVPNQSGLNRTLKIATTN